MTLSEIANIIEGPSGLYFSQNEKSNKEIIESEVKLLNSSEGSIVWEDIKIKEKNILRNIVNVENKDFIVLDKLGQQIGSFIYIKKENHNLKKVLPSNKIIVITNKEGDNLFSLYLELKKLEETNKLQTYIRKHITTGGYNTLNTISIKDIKKITIEKQNKKLSLEQFNTVFNIVEAKEKVIKNLKLMIKELDKSQLSLFNQTTKKVILNNKEIVIPKEWEIHKVKDLVSFNTGKVLSSKDFSTNGNTRALTISDFSSSSYKKENKYLNLTKEEIQKIKKRNQYKEKKDILLALSHEIGKVCEEEVEGVFNNHLFKVTSKNEKKLLNEYLPVLFSIKEVLSGIKRFSTMGTMPHSYDSKKLLEIPVPTLKEQKEFIKKRNILKETLKMEEELLIKYEKLIKYMIKN